MTPVLTGHNQRAHRGERVVASWWWGEAMFPGHSPWALEALISRRDDRRRRKRYYLDEADRLALAYETERDERTRHTAPERRDAELWFPGKEKLP